MKKFILVSFLVLGVGFYELSGGAHFEPEMRAPVAIAETDLTPNADGAAVPQVTRNDTSSLIEIPAPTALPPARVEAVSFTAPLPAGQVVIIPAPDAVSDEVVAPVTEDVITLDTAGPDVRAVSGDWVNMRSGPSTNYDVLSTLPRGTQAEVMEVDAEGWARIRVTDTGQVGWMAERLLSDS